MLSLLLKTPRRRRIRWLNTVLAVCEFLSFASGKTQEKGCSAQAETWQMKKLKLIDR